MYLYIYIYVYICIAAIHPESYKAAKTALDSFSFAEGAAALDSAEMATLRQKLAAAGVQVGDLTLNDIVESLRTAGRDPRETLLGVLFKSPLVTQLAV